MKIAIITDTHYGIRNDSIVFHDYFKKFFDEIFFPHLKKHDIKTVIHLGDLFDRRKYVNFVTAKRCREDFLEPMEKMGLDVHVLVGNHDTTFRNTNSVNSLHELIVGKFNNFSVYTEPTEIIFDNEKILLLPWICEENQVQSFNLIESTDAQVCMGHLELSGFEMYRGVPSQHGLEASLFEKFDVVCSGHYHHNSNKGNIYYLGAFAEFVWSDYNDLRGFHVYDTKTRSFEFFENPYKMFKMIIYNDADETSLEQIRNLNYDDFKETHVKIVCMSKTNPYIFDLMLDKLYDSNTLSITVIEDENFAIDNSEDEKITQAEDTPSALNTYIDGLVLTAVDPNRLKKLINSIYNEALLLENLN